MPTPYNAKGSGLPFLVNKPVPKLALSFGQGAGGIVASLRDLTTWDRALYTGKVLPPRQQHELESLVNVFTSKPVQVTSSTDPVAYGLGVIQATYSPIGLFWTYEGGTAGMRVWHVYDPRTGVVIALALNSSAGSPDPADNGPDQDTVDQLGFRVYRALERYGAIKPPAQAGRQPSAALSRRSVSAYRLISPGAARNRHGWVLWTEGAQTAAPITNLAMSSVPVPRRAAPPAAGIP